MRPLIRMFLVSAWVGLVCAALASNPASAQISPSNMRSGYVTGSGGFQIPTLFTVPAGMNFVLTDLEWVPDMNFGAGMGFLRLSLSLQSGGGTCIAGPRAQWFALLFDDGVGGRQTSNIPLSVHWSTGVVFCPADPIQLNIGDLNALTQWRINWSGYLAPVGTSSVETGTSQDLALEVSPNPTQSSARVEFRLPVRSRALVGIFDVNGRKVRTLFRGELSEGPHSLAWDGRDDQGQLVGNGIYLAKLETGGQSRAKKLARIVR